jgi:hypothetical protein
VAALLVAASLLCALPSSASADPVSDAYAFYTAGEYEKARDVARGAIAADPSSATLLARKVLILSLKELGALDDATTELARLREFALLPADVAWADERDAELAALRDAETEPEAGISEPTSAPIAEPAPAPAPEEPRGATAETALETPASPRPAVVLALGGGFAQLGGWSYGSVGGQGAVRMVGPLWFAVGADLGVSPGADCSGAPGDEGACAALLTAVRIGAMARFDLAVQPYLDAGFVLGINGTRSPYRAAVPGLEVGGGVELGAGPVAVRPRAAFRLLGALNEAGAAVPGAVVGVDVAVRLGGRR